MQQRQLSSQQEEDSQEYHTPPEDLSEQKRMNYEDCVEPAHLQHAFHEQR